MIGRMTLVLAITTLGFPTESLDAQKVCTPEREKAITAVVDTLNARHQELFGKPAVKEKGALEVYVSSVLWSIWDAEQKENMTYTLSAWWNCIVRPTHRDAFTGESMGKGDYYHGVTLFDAQSGKKLATIGAFRGYRIFDVN